MQILAVAALCKGLFPELPLASNIVDIVLWKTTWFLTQLLSVLVALEKNSHTLNQIGDPQIKTQSWLQLAVTIPGINVLKNH